MEEKIRDQLKAFSIPGKMRRWEKEGIARDDFSVTNQEAPGPELSVTVRS